MRFDRTTSWALFSLLMAVIAPPVLGQGTNDVPFHQDKPPGPALSPEQAMAKMQLPPGFKIECIAHEPDVINPTSFTFDDQGRIWITESFEYPRASAGPGNDPQSLYPYEKSLISAAGKPSAQSIRSRRS